jgi:hypothetical protein
MLSWLSNGVLVLAVLIVAAHVWALRQALRQREPIAMPMATATWMAILTIAAVLVFGLSPLHLLWLLPLITFLSLPLGVSAVITNITFRFLALLAGPLPESPPASETPPRKRQRRPRKKR